jgi:hypothetical protein
MTINTGAATRGTRLVALHEEMGSLSFENKLYWDQGLAHVRKEVSAYERRLDRLEEIRRELMELGN